MNKSNIIIIKYFQNNNEYESSHNAYKIIPLETKQTCQQNKMIMQSKRKCVVKYHGVQISVGNKLMQ